MIKQQPTNIGHDYAVRQIMKRRKKMPVRMMNSQIWKCISDISDLLAVFCVEHPVKSDCERCILNHLCQGYWDIGELERITAAIVGESEEVVQQKLDEERRRNANPLAYPPAAAAAKSTP